MDFLRIGPALALVLLALVAAAAVLVLVGRLGRAREVVLAAARATGQLGLVSLLITAVIASAGWTAVFVAVMIGVAAVTAGKRITGQRWRGAGWAALSILAGTVPVLSLILASGILPLRPVAILPVAGIVIGGAMTATALAGRRALDELDARFGEYEAGLALGLPARAAALEVCRPAAALALLPALDQTRTVGLVTLPGAFVGVLLAGADPLRTGATQLLVLIALLAAESVAVLVTVELAATGRLRRPPTM